MLVRGETTEDRIAKIAQGFGQGIQNFQGQQDRQRNQGRQDQQYQDQVDARKAEFEQRKAERERALNQDQVNAEDRKLTNQKKLLEIGELMKPIEQRDSFKEKAALQRLNTQNKPLNSPEGKIAQKQMEKLGVGNAGLYNVKSAMDEALKILQDPSVGEDQKIKTGQSLFKLLNSAEGSDAVGAEEAKRIGSYLEYNIGNFTQPGAFIGRDLGGFTDQIKNYSTLLDGRIKTNERGISTLRGGGSLSSVAQEVNTQQAGASKAPWEKYKK